MLGDWNGYLPMILGGSKLNGMEPMSPKVKISKYRLAPLDETPPLLCLGMIIANAQIPSVYDEKPSAIRSSDPRSGK